MSTWVFALNVSHIPPPCNYICSRLTAQLRAPSEQCWLILKNMAQVRLTQHLSTAGVWQQVQQYQGGPHAAFGSRLFASMNGSAHSGHVADQAGSSCLKAATTSYVVCPSRNCLNHLGIRFSIVKLEPSSCAHSPSSFYYWLLCPVHLAPGKGSFSNNKWSHQFIRKFHKSESSGRTAAGHRQRKPEHVFFIKYDQQNQSVKFCLSAVIREALPLQSVPVAPLTWEI